MGILDQLLGTGADDPRTQAMGILGAQLMAGNAAGAFGGANSHFAQAKQDALKQQLIQAQLANYQSEVEQRKAAIAKQTQLQEMAQRIINGGGGGANAVPGQLGSGSFGAVAPPAGMSDIPPPAQSGLGGARLNDIVALHAAGGPDLLNAYKYANEGVERKPGSFYDIPGRGRPFIPDPKSGMDYQNGRINPIPGYSDFLTQQTLAQEAPKTLLSSAAQINLRDNPDGTKSPISALSENPTLQNVLQGVFGQRGAQPPAAPQAAPVAPPAAANPAQISPNDQRTRDAEAMRMIQSEIDKEQNPQTKAALQREFDRMAAAQAKPGFPAPSASQPRPGMGYGKTTAQEAQEAASKAGMVKTAEQTAVDVAEQRKGIMNAGFMAPSNIAKYKQLGALLADVDGGKLTQTGTNIASMANSIGLKIDKNLPNKEAAAALGNAIALELRSPAGGAGMPGALSDKDREFLQGMVPNAGQSAQGRKMLIDSYVAVQQRNQQVATFARNYEKKHGKLDNGFFDQLQSWSNANPLFGGK